MFVRTATLTQLSVSSEDILHLLTSLNRPMVALEEYPTDEADATICTVRRESDMVSTIVHLLLQQANTGVFFHFESDPYPEDLRGPVEEEALAFVEGLGFIMDDSHYGDLDPDGRKALLERAIFTGARGAAPAPAGVALEVAEDPALLYIPPAAEADPAREEAPVPAALEREREIVLLDVMQDASDDDLDRAVAAFMEPPAQVPQASPPEPKPAPAGGGRASPSLSRFHRRQGGADIYAIRGLGRAAAPQAAPAAAPAQASIAEPGPVSAAAGDVPTPPTAERQPATPEPPAPDPETRRRRARARYLASF
jgi:hypothetical protein